MKCEGNPFIEHTDECPIEPTWKICCPNPNCHDDVSVCDPHEFFARAQIVSWINDGGYCTSCGLRFSSPEHATSRWYRLADSAQTA